MADHPSLAADEAPNSYWRRRLTAINIPQRNGVVPADLFCGSGVQGRQDTNTQTQTSGSVSPHPLSNNNTYY